MAKSIFISFIFVLGLVSSPQIKAADRDTDYCNLRDLAQQIKELSKVRNKEKSVQLLNFNVDDKGKVAMLVPLTGHGIKLDTMTVHTTSEIDPEAKRRCEKLRESSSLRIGRISGKPLIANVENSMTSELPLNSSSLSTEKNDRPADSFVYTRRTQ